MDANSLTRFAQACGAVRPLDLLLERPNGTIGKNASIPKPFAVVGSDLSCDLALPDSELAPRHLAIQIVQSRVFIVDISGQPNGLVIAGVPRSDGWINEGDAVVLAGNRLYLTAPVAPPLAELTKGFHPLVPNPEAMSRFTRTCIEFRNGRTAQSRWDVNRVMTFVGRAKACKINLTSEDVSTFHCYFLLTNDGLWCVDLIGRGGMAVNGMPNRFYRMSIQDDLTIARFHLGVGYPNGDPGEPIVPLAAATPISSSHDIFNSNYHSPSPSRASAGVSPSPQDANSNRLPDTPSPRVEMPKDLVLPGIPTGGAGHPSAAITGQMFEQFQQSMLMMMKMFGQMHQQQMQGIQQEMARLATLTEEIGQMQGQIAKAVEPQVVVPHYNPLPMPEEVPQMNESTADQHQLIFDKMAKLEAERQTIWKRLTNVFAAKPVTA